jgi:hypothetical protein
MSQGSNKHTGRDGSNTIPLKSISKTKSKGSQLGSQMRSQTHSKRRSEDEDDKIETGDTNPSFRPDRVQHNTTAYWGKNVEPDAQSGQSQESSNSEAKIIRKDIQWRVHYENQGGAV